MLYHRRFPQCSSAQTTRGLATITVSSLRGSLSCLRNATYRRMSKAYPCSYQSRHTRLAATFLYIGKKGAPVNCVALCLPTKIIEEEECQLVIRATPGLVDGCLQAYGMQTLHQECREQEKKCPCDFYIPRKVPDMIFQRFEVKRLVILRAAPRASQKFGNIEALPGTSPV